MKNKRLIIFHLLSLAGVLAVCAYPLYMGARVAADMLRDGAVLKENYPKYVIPYTPMAVSLLLGVMLMPLLTRLRPRRALIWGLCIAVCAFFALEFLLETRVVVDAVEEQVQLEDWQMFMCYVAPKAASVHKSKTPVEILMGEYSPAFKLHFYFIAVLLISALLNCFYGFDGALRTGRNQRLRALTMQSVAAGLLLGMCVLACFTAFWRDGSLRVSPLSAALMALFFLLFGLTAGLFAGSFLLKKGRRLAALLPAALAAGCTALMYAGEMILLNGHLYLLGSGPLFQPLPYIVFAPADLLIILFSGLCALFACRAMKKEQA